MKTQNFVAKYARQVNKAARMVSKKYKAAQVRKQKHVVIYA